MYFKRTKGKYNTDYGINDIYKFYKNKAKDPVSKDLFKEIYTIYIEEIKKAIVEETFEFHMGKLGSLRMKAKESLPEVDSNGNMVLNRMTIDWGATRKLWETLYQGLTAEEVKQIPNKKLIRAINNHTDNKRYKYFWDRIRTRMRNQSYYDFEATRTWTENAAKFFKSGKPVIHYK
jgi:hypothetical protein